MKVIIPEELKGKELFKFLVENKSRLIAQKKAMIKRTEPISVDPSYYKKGETKTKTAFGEIPADATNFMVKVVANAAWWCDSQMDVLLPDNAKKSMRERKGMIPHLHDHIHEIGAEVGDVEDIFYEDISLSELGLTKSGSTQCLIFETDIQKSYNEKVFTKYKKGKIKQHSIGLQYVKLELAINDEESEKEFDFWNKYVKDVINREFVEEKGFFWVVPEIKLLENSAVLFGSNELTPTLNVGSKNTLGQPSEDTDEEPLVIVPAFDLDKAIRELKFFN